LTVVVQLLIKMFRINNSIKKLSIPVSYIWLSYVFIALWNFRLDVGSSWIPLGQLVVIMLTLICLISVGKFYLYRTIDDYIVSSVVIFICINSLAHAVFSSDTENASMRILSLLASLVIILPYYVSRSVYLRDKQELFIKVLFLGMSLYVLDIFVSYVFAYLQYNSPFVGRSTIGQRVPVVINLIFMLGLVYKTKNYHFMLYARVISAVSLFLMIVSLTRSAYLALCVDILLLLLMYRKSKRYIFMVLSLLLIPYIFGTFSQVGGRFDFMIESISDPSVDYSASYRVEIWKSIYDYMISTPINLLFGTGELGIAYLQRDIDVFGNNYIAMSAESQYFDTFLRRGVFGLFLFLLIVYRTLKLSLKLMKIDAKHYWIYFSIFTWLLAMVPYNLFNESIRYRTIGILFFVIYGFLVTQTSYVNKNRRVFWLDS
jgi:hypothetical protein